GVLTEWVSWRAVFFINLPLGALVVAGSQFTLPKRPRPSISRTAIDWVGIPLLVASLGSLVLALMQGQTWGWSSPAVLALLVVAAVLVPLFLWWETRAAAPLIDLSLYKLQNFATDSTILAGLQFALIGASVFGAI